LIKLMTAVEVCFMTGGNSGGQLSANKTQRRTPEL
jgi:hypothetical protein